MKNADPQTTEPCPICQGSGTRGQMQGGNRMAVIECEVCGGDGSLPVFDDVAFERAKDESRYG